jgi:hypothetical protein
MHGSEGAGARRRAPATRQCVARSKKAHAEGEKCGPARLDKMLTEARAITPWLRKGSSVPQQQLIRDFGTSRAKALAEPSSVRVYQDSIGHWYASFVVPPRWSPCPPREGSSASTGA